MDDLNNTSVDYSKAPGGQVNQVAGSSPKETNSHLDIFALIIGINKYEHYPSLNGAVHDANAIKDFFCKTLKVPCDRDRITILLDEDATGSAIVKALRAFKDNEQIVKNKTAILIYFAGHGARVKAPNDWPGWKTDDGYIELLCPVDGEKKVPDSAWDSELVKGECIPDQRISDILRELSNAKGNNITLICDCCHSAGMNRGDDLGSDPSLLVRGVDEIKSDPTRYGARSNLPECGDGRMRGENPKVKVPSRKGFCASWDSHVFLAACSSDQKAREIGGAGRFTTALLEVLKGPDQEHTRTDLTYRALMHEVVAKMQEMEQTPCIYGKHIHRRIFTRSGPETVARPMIPCKAETLTDTSRRMFLLHAGHSAGPLHIRKNSTYAIYDTDSPIPTSPPLTTAKVLFEEGKIMLEDNQPLSQGHNYTGVLYARLSKCHVANLLVHYDPKKIDLLSSSNEPVFPFLRNTDHPDKVDICLEVDAGAGNKVSISRGNTNTYFAKNGDCFDKMEGNRIFKQAEYEGFPAHFSYKPLASNIDGIKQFIDAYAHFTYHLTSGSPRKIEDLVSVEMHELKRHSDNRLEVVKSVPLPPFSSQDSQTRGEFVEVAVDLDISNARDNNDAPRYGLTIRRKSISSQVGTLYPHIFTFDASTLQIDPIYSNMSPNISERNVETCLTEEGNEIPFGYSRGMVKPIVFGLPAGQNVDVTFIKIFVTTETVDLRCISQPALGTAFEDGADRVSGGDRPLDPIQPDPVRASMTIPVLVKRQAEGPF